MFSAFCLHYILIHVKSTQFYVPYTSALLTGFLVVGQSSALKNCVKDTTGNTKSSTLVFVFVNLVCFFAFFACSSYTHVVSYKCNCGRLEDLFHLVLSGFNDTLPMLSKFGV